MTAVPLLYEVKLKVLDQAVRRNRDRFPADFMSQLTREEGAFLRSQFVTLKTGLHPRGSGAKVWELSVFGDEPDATLGGRLRPDGELADGLDDSGDGFVMMQNPAFELVELCRKFPVCGNHLP